MPSHSADAKPQAGNDDTMQPGLMGMCIFFIVFTTVVVFFRLGCQYAAHRRLYWDDLWIGISLILSDILLGVNILGVKKGTGVHMEQFLAEHPNPIPNIIVLAKVGLINATMSLLILYSVKMSLLHLYRRIFWSAHWFRVSWWVNLVYVNLWVVAAFFTALFQCTPVSFYWNKAYLESPVRTEKHPRGHCMTPDFIIYISVFSLLSNIGIWAMPIMALVKLQMPIKRKIELGLLLSLGSGACICGLGKAVNARKSLTNEDRTWYYSIIFIWSVVEENLTILCACVAVIVGCLRSIRRRGSKAASAGSGLPDQSGGSSGKGYSRISIEMKPHQEH